jgi:LPS export ABC transporter protein LptC
MKIFYCSIVAALFAIAGCDESPKVSPSASGTAVNGDKPAQVSYKTSMNFSSDGLLRAILHAGRVQTFDLQHYSLLDSGVKVDFYNGTGVHSSILTSDRAKVNSTNNNMTAYGHVHIVSDSGTIVDTDSLDWDNKSQTIHSTAAVHIVEKDGRTTDGIGFESDQNLANYHILHTTIVAPSSGFQQRSGQPDENDLKPEEQAVPGGGGINPPVLQPLMSIPAKPDSERLKK